jgi:type IV secretory pathway VirB3-like protein
MWVFFTARLRQWLFLAVVLPLIAVVIHAVRQAIEKRTGETRFTRLLAQVETLGRRRKRK